MNGPIIRWGILGAANIARKNWQAIWNSGNGVVSAVASREIERGRRFIDECQAQAAFASVPRALGSYEELLADPGIDAVYIPLPTAARKAWVMRAAAAGKHVICEKPCAIGVTDLEEMLEACRRHHVQFMDGVMFMHSRRLDRIREALDDGETIGPLRRIVSAFTWPQPEAFFATNIRARSELEPEGCLGDLGWYCIRFALWAMRWQLPREVTGRVLSEFKHPDSPCAVPTEFAGELFFDGRRVESVLLFLHDRPRADRASEWHPRISARAGLRPAVPRRPDEFRNREHGVHRSGVRFHPRTPRARLARGRTEQQPSQRPGEQSVPPVCRAGAVGNPQRGLAPDGAPDPASDASVPRVRARPGTDRGDSLRSGSGSAETAAPHLGFREHENSAIDTQFLDGLVHLERVAIGHEVGFADLGGHLAEQVQHFGFPAQLGADFRLDAPRILIHVTNHNMSLSLFGPLFFTPDPGDMPDDLDL